MTRLKAIWRSALVMAAVAGLAGAGGVYAGFALFAPSAPQRGSLDVIVHRQIDLSPDQEVRIHAIEVTYAERRLALETDMRSTTREIADAIAEDSAYTDRVKRGVSAFHVAMGELQEATILHVFEMRSVLTPSQQEEFDAIVHAELLRSDDRAGPD